MLDIVFSLPPLLMFVLSIISDISVAVLNRDNYGVFSKHVEMCNSARILLAVSHMQGSHFTTELQP